MCVAYPALDFMIIIISIVAIHRVKLKAQELIKNPKFSEYAEDAAVALEDIQYLPNEFESEEEDGEY